MPDIAEIRKHLATLTQSDSSWLAKVQAMVTLVNSVGSLCDALETDWSSASVDQLQRERDEAIARLPAGMKNCTIYYRECRRGHGRLTADNRDDCQTCALEDAQAALAEATVGSQCLGCGKLTQGRAGLVNSGFYAPSCGSKTCSDRIEKLACEARSRLADSEIKNVNAAASDPLVLSRALGDAAFQAGEVVIEVALKYTWLQYVLWGAIGGAAGVVSMRRWDGDRWVTEPVVWLTSSTLTAHARFVKYSEAAMAPTVRGEIP